MPFNAARDYIFENNTKLFVFEKAFPDRKNPVSIFRLCVLREEATHLHPIECWSAQMKGIKQVGAFYPDSTVLINGNQCFFSDGTEERPKWKAALRYLWWEGANLTSKMADKCHGRLVQYGQVNWDISSDEYVKPSPLGSRLAAPDPIPLWLVPGGKYVGQAGKDWVFAPQKQNVPGNGATTFNALGGLSTYYDSPDRAEQTHQIIGRATLKGDGKGCVFTATQMTGSGLCEDFKKLAEKSGVPKMQGSSRTGYDLELLILDCGTGSVALSHIDPKGTLKNTLWSRKQYGLPCYVNNYLALEAQTPR